MKFAVCAIVAIFKIVTVYSGGDSFEPSLPSLDVNDVLDSIEGQLDEIDILIALAEADDAEALAEALAALETAVNELRSIDEDPETVAELIAELEEFRDFLLQFSTSASLEGEGSRRKRHWSFMGCNQLQGSISNLAIRRGGCQRQLTSCRAQLPGLRSRCSRLQGRSFFGRILNAFAPCLSKLVNVLNVKLAFEARLVTSIGSLSSTYSRAVTQHSSYCSTPTLDFSIFSRIDHLFDNSGRYLKTACLVEQFMSYSSAVSYCAERGFKLFTIDSPSLQTKFFQLLSAQYADYDFGGIWVDGMRDFNGNWMSSSQNPISGISWKVGFPSGDGNCLKVCKFSIFDPFGIADTSCNDQNWFYVEYVNPIAPIPTNPPTLPPPPPTTPRWIPDLSIFSRRDNIYVNGVYVKTACLLEQFMTYDSAVTYLSQRGFKLFTVDSLGLQTQFLQLLGSIFSEFDEGFIWINGKKLSGTWYSTPPQTLIAGISWKGGQPSGAGDCLTVCKFTQNDPFGMSDRSCSGENVVYAEYVDPSLTTTAAPTTVATTAAPITEATTVAPVPPTTKPIRSFG